MTDGAGNATGDASASELIVDTVVPVVPTVDPQTTNDVTPIISGTATVASGEALIVEVDGITYTAGNGNLVDNSDGTWDLTIPVGSEIDEGTYDVVATVTDAAGNASSDATTSELVVDTTAPAAPTTASQNTSNTLPVISGTASVGLGETLTVTVDGVTYTTGDGNLVDNGDGTWDLTIPVGNEIDEGTYDVVATVTDAAGNASSDATTSELVVDTTAPAAPTTASQNTNNTLPVISGTANVGPGETLNVSVDGITYTAGDGNLVDNGDGTWELTIPVGNEIDEGTYDVVATVTDAAGNASSDATTSELVVDTTAPAAPTTASQNTSNTLPVVSGTATVGPGETLNVTVDGITYTAGDGNLVDNGDGTWELTIPAANELVDGEYDVMATVTDSAGNATVDASASELIVDTVVPVVPTVVPQTTNDVTPIISGTATVASGEALAVEVDGITYTAGNGNLVDNSDGTWDLTIPVGSEIDEGTYDVVATVTDAAGNASSDATTSELVVDTTAPAAPTTASQNTNNTLPVISGTASVGPGETLNVSVDGITYTAGDGNLVDNGDGTWDLTIPAANELADGEYDVIATVTDGAGNATGDTSVSELVIDTIAPVTPTVDPQTTTNITPLISGTATVATGETLTVEVDDVFYVAGDGNLVDNGDGTWDLTIPVGSEIDEGTYDVVATVTDAAGNASSDATTSELVVDTTAPAAPTTASQNTSNTLPVVSGTATVGPGETLNVSVDGITYTAGDGNLVDNGDGTWDLTIPAANELVDGEYDVMATVTDSAGNATVDASASELIVDTVVPVAPTVVPQTTNDVTPIISGTATVASGETLTVEVDGVHLHRWKRQPCRQQ